MNEEKEKTIDEFSQEEWDRIWRCAIAKTTKRAELEWRWERRLQTANRIAVGVGIYLIAQFPALYVGFSLLERSALQFCASL